ncbi:unnamed protein product [Porites evermanni]|uniref:Uncharacterized protein n=1 Tax=Porites evermanni TaxID=104178 RepID=A0ABN8RVN7_9CNID|nr:unnamed protein product [Porites evermanni]
MKTSKTLFCLMLFTLVVLNEGRPARNNSRHGQQVHVRMVIGKKNDSPLMLLVIYTCKKVLLCLYRKYSGGRSIVKVAPLFFNFQCARVKGRRCMEDDECACVNRHNGTLICNWQKKCKRSVFLDDIIRKQPCHGVFKRTCEVHDDCPCSEKPLICEDRECVKAKKCFKVEGRNCSKDSECVCVNHHNAKETLTCNSENRCERQSPHHIMSLQPCPGVFKRLCKVNSDCPCSEHPLICENRECVKALQRFKKAY